MEIRDLLDLRCLPPQGEWLEVLLARPGLRLERILSAGGSRAGPYDQPQDEWVLLLQGRALLEVAGQRVELGPGQALLLPAHTRHCVLDTSAEPPCIWLAMHMDVAPGPALGLLVPQ
jgi:cupin 2 domain-containing protein